MKTEILDKNVIKSFGKGSKKELKQGGRAVIYQRVSSKVQEDGFSPETQKECCYNWAEKHNFIVVKCFEGEHESAKSDMNRKRFNQMLKFVMDKKNKIDAVIVYNTSRFSRTGSFSVVEELKKRELPYSLQHHHTMQEPIQESICKELNYSVQNLTTEQKQKQLLTVAPEP